MEGTEPLQLTVDNDQLVPGQTYTATVTFEAPDADNSPVSVDIEVSFAEGVTGPGCGCASGGQPARLAWLPGLLLVGLAGTRRRSRVR